MGYYLNSLSNLSIDDDVHFYIFVIHETWKDELMEKIETNFREIAKSIGDNAVIGIGTKPEFFSDEVSKAYLGDNMASYLPLLPALLVTNDHPDKINESTLRLFVPLATVDERFGGWNNFFRLLSNFVRNKDNEFLQKFQNRNDALDANKAIKLNIGFGGLGINLNEFISWWTKRQKEAQRPRYT